MITTHLKNSNGRIAAYIQEATASPVGTLVCVHGGPGGDHHGNGGIFTDIAEFCGDLGYHVVQFDMFGAGDSDGTPAQITLQTQFADYQTVLEFSKANFPVPVHVVGESMGATIAALDWRRDVASHVLLWPAFDLRDTDLRPYLHDPWRSLLATQGYLVDDGLTIGKAFVDEIASFDFAPCFKLPTSPCLLIHGKGDGSVPFNQSLTAVAQASGECVLFAHPTGDHGLQRPNERDLTREAIKWWLARPAS